MQKKILVDQEEIKNALRACIKPYTIAKKLNVPITVVHDIRDGKDRPSFFRKPIRDRNKFCTCCGFREKMPGAKYLCFICFAANSQDIGDSEFSLCL